MPPGSTPLACSSVDYFKIKYQIATPFVKTKAIFFNYNRCFGTVLIFNKELGGELKPLFASVFSKSHKSGLIR